MAPVELAPGMRRGVVSLPHGWGHDRGGTRQGVAADQPGVNVNQLNDGGQLDPLSGTAVLNGIPVDIAARRLTTGQLPDHRHREADGLLAGLQRHGRHLGASA